MPVEFNDENKSSVLYARFESSNKQPTLVRWLISARIVKTPEQANGVLIAIAVLAIVLAGIIYYRTNDGSTVSSPSPAQAQLLEGEMHIPSATQ